MNESIAIIGASYLQLPLVKKAKEMGFITHVFAWEDGAICKNEADYFYPISITDIDSIGKICESIKPMGVVSIASDLANITVNHLANRLGLTGNSLESTHISTDKFAMREAFSKAGLLCPKYLLYNSENLKQLSEMCYPLIVKPVDRSGSRGVSLTHDESELMIAVEQAYRVSFSKGVIIEEFISGREISVESISWHGKHHILQFTDKVTTGAPNFVEKAHHQPAKLSEEQISVISSLVKGALDALQIEFGASHTEIILTNNDEIYLVEIGSRMGGDCIGSHLVQLSTGYDFLKAVLEIAVGKFEEPLLKGSFYSGIHYLFPDPGILKSVDYHDNKDIVEYHVTVGIGDEILAISDSSMRAGYYIYRSNHRLEYNHNILELITEKPEDAYTI